jgi:hypothetical protein
MPRGNLSSPANFRQRILHRHRAQKIVSRQKPWFIWQNPITAASPVKILRFGTFPAIKLAMQVWPSNPLRVDYKTCFGTETTTIIDPH